MKEVKAFVKPHMLAKVVMALHALPGLSGLTVTKVQGFGRGRAEGELNRFEDDQVEYVPQVRIEVFCRDALAEKVVSVIRENAHTGLQGDGKIYVSQVLEAVRISTGERGEEAV